MPTNPPRVTFGDRLRRVRLNTGLTQDQFAVTIGVSGAAIGKWELQQEDPRNAQMIANAVQAVHGVPACWLLCGVCQDDPPEIPEQRDHDATIDLRDRPKPRRWIPQQPRLSRAPHDLPRHRPELGLVS